MIADLTVSDEVVIGFFSAVVIGLSAAVVALWRNNDSRRNDSIKSKDSNSDPQP